MKPLSSSYSSALLVGVCMFVMALLSSCKPTGPTPSKPPASETASVTVDSVNYMHDRGVKYTIYDLSKTPPLAVGGAIVYMLGTGGEKGCCIALPKTWRPGMMLRVVWSEADRQQTFPGEYTRDLEVPRYEEPADLYVVFYSDQKIELIVSNGEPGHPEWRGKIKDTPWDACLRQNERRICKAALPKQFDTASSQGFCTFTQSPDYPKENFDGETLCASAMHQCMKDYEDEVFCKGILWGPRRK